MATAKDAIGEWTNGLAETDDRYYEEWLTKTDGGQYILCGAGNKESQYARSPGKEGGYGVKFISPADAEKWLADHPEKI